MKSPALRPQWVAPQRTALLVIDLQVDFAAPEGGMARQGADMRAVLPALERAKRLVAAARAAGVMCVFTRAVTAPEQQTAVQREAKERHGGSAPPLCVEGTPGAAFVEPRPQGQEQVVSKQRYSVFTGTKLGEKLKARGIDTLVLCGLTTECCVQSSAWEAFERDFHVFIAADACAAYEEELHRGALKGLEMNGAMLAATADFAAAWK